MNESRNPTLPLLGRYQPIIELAKSPIGGLVMALDVPERRVVAIRSLPVEGKVPSETLAQLLEAGRWVKGLDDPAVMAPLDVGTQEGLLHAAFLYNIAEPLRGVLRLASFRGSPMPVGVALRIAYDVVLGARALEACGASPALGESLSGGLIPDSVLVGHDGRSRLCDAGIGAILRRTNEYGQHPDLLSYAAPEQLEGGGIIDGRSDVFTIGIFLWEMLANRRLFSAHQTHAVADKVRNLVVPSLDTQQRGATEPLPPVVANIIKRALERSPSDRYAGTTALLQTLETQAREFMAAPETVQPFVSALVGNIFESRLRAMDRAVKTSERHSAASPIAVPSPVASGSLDPRPRAAVTNNSATDPNAYETLDPESLAPDTIRDKTEESSGTASTADSAPAKSTSVYSVSNDRDRPVVAPPRLPSMPSPPARTSKPAPVGTSKPPLIAAIPTLPSRFELPGAELFATPGLPPVKHAAQAPELAAVDTPPQASLPETAAFNHKVNPVGPTVPAPPDLSSLEPDSATTSESRHPERRRSKREFAWISIISVVAFAFVAGIGIRRCAFHNNQDTAVRRADFLPPATSSDAATAVVDSSVTLQQLDASAVDAAMHGVDAAIPAPTLDAGVAAASAIPRVQPVPARTPMYRTAPRSSGKVSKARGKISRSR